MELSLEQALEKGIAAHRAENFNEADRYYTAILKIEPKHPDANHNMGVLAINVDKINEALPFFKVALEGNPKITQFWLSYIDTLIKLNRIDEAKIAFDQAQKEVPQVEGFNKLRQMLEVLPKSSTEPITKNLLQDPPEHQVQPLVSFYKQGKLQQALTEALNLLSEFPQSATVYNIIGAVNQGLGKLTEAIDAYNKALLINPTDAEIHNNIGVTLKKLGRLGEAIEAYNKALSINPTDEEIYNNLGNALKENGNFNESIEAYKKALSIKPEYADAHYNMGIALNQQGQLDKAILAYTKALSIIPNYAEVYNDIGITLYRQNKFEEAIESYEKALSLKPDYAEAYNNTADVLKMYSPKKHKSHILFVIDKKIKKLSKKLEKAKSNKEITDCLIKGLNYLFEDSFRYKTPLSQIYHRNNIDLNCRRHEKIFSTKNIIPEFCFGCFKVQVEVDTFIDLVKVTSLFYNLDFKYSFTKKTMIELRPNISGSYKGLIYCRGLDQAELVKNLLDPALRKLFDKNTASNIKRGCSEFSLQFPEYGKISAKPEDMARFPKAWASFEREFDEIELIEPMEERKSSLPGFCLSDFYIIQKWIDYGKGIGDQSVKIFGDRPIVFKDIHELAKTRTLS